MLPFEKITREIITKREASTNPDLGTAPEKRTVQEMLTYGIINMDKPAGPTSHQVSDMLKNVLKIDKAGHSGTLDPAVTGVLPIALGRATRIVANLLNAGKEYIALMHLHKEVPKNEIQEVFKKFTGKIIQLPPIRSSIKRQERARTIYDMEILDTKDKDILFSVSCQAGTYIRKLIHDIGQELKVGAHMQELRRTKAGPFNESTLFTLQDVTDALHYYKKGNEKFIRKVIQPIENAIAHLPKIWISDGAVEPLCHGTDLAVPGVVNHHTVLQKKYTVAVMTLKDELVAVGSMRMDSIELREKEKGIAVKIEKVFMQPGTYKTK